PLTADRYSDLQDKVRTLVKEGLVDEAKPYAAAMIEAQPYNENAQYLYARILLLGRSPEAFRENCRKADALLASSAKILEGVSDRGEPLGLRLFYLGLARWYCGDPVQAVSMFQRSFRADFQRLDALYNIYAILEEQGARAEAEVAWKAYLRASKKKTKD
ncbi:MAG: hypothetical protein HY042_04945, partial [Spirochaetia bacterium]|nr:hypothetical protein [Spirochaetia bacterium]